MNLRQYRPEHDHDCRLHHCRVCGGSRFCTGAAHTFQEGECSCGFARRKPTTSKEQKRKIARGLLAVAFTLLATSALASPIESSYSGCVSSLPDGASWQSSDPTGFVFMAFWDEVAGCEPTIRNPTGGFHVAWVLEGGGYRIDVLSALLPRCGRVQFDAHAYSAIGLDPSGLRALVFNSGVDCVGLGVITPPVPPAYVPPLNPPALPPVDPPVHVPDSSSTAPLLVAVLCVMFQFGGSSHVMEKKDQGGEGKWQPIETARQFPYRRVLLWWTTRGASSGYFDVSPERCGWRGDQDLVIPLDQHHCTHWMPLPLAPKEIP